MLALFAVLVSTVLQGGCGFTTAFVKQNLQDGSGLANALMRSFSLGHDAKKDKDASSVQNSYPAVPSDDNDPRVRKFIREYAYNRRDTMKTYLARAENYLPMVKKLIRENDAPEDLAYLFLLESGANPEARSPANAVGMWQFMPDTARNYGLRVDSWVDERLDPEKSTKAAVRYLKDLYGMFGCWRLALSAYNSGENKMSRVLCREDAEDYDEICTSRHLKKETKEFFPRFQAIAHIAKHTEKYGFTPLKNKGLPPRNELVSVQGAYSLASLAGALGMESGALSKLNPGLLRETTPKDGRPYTLKVPMGKKLVLAEKLKSLRPEPVGRNSEVIHVVHKGDNLARICKRYGINKGRLAKLNPNVNLRNKLKRGVRLVVSTHKPAFRTSLRKNGRMSVSSDI